MSTVVNPALDTEKVAIDKFLQAIFMPGDRLLLRPIETWIEGGRKRSAVDYKGTEYVLVGLKDQSGNWQSMPDRLAWTIDRQNQRSGQTKANIFFGVCPRFGTGGQYDQAWQIRTVRVLWSDIDHCTQAEALSAG